MATRLSLAPTLQLLPSRWPVLSIWRYNTQPGSPKPEARAEDIMILRREYDPEPHLLPPGGATFLGAFNEGATLGMAFDAAESEAPGFDLTALLTLLVSNGAITDPETRP